MTSLLDPTRVDPTERPVARALRRRWIVVAIGICLVLAACASVLYARSMRLADLHRNYLGSQGWPVRGQAAYSLGDTEHIGPRQSPQPIASLAKVMTVRLVLAAMPLGRDGAGPRITVSVRDVHDYLRRRADDQSVLAVRAGERLTQRQALLAVLLPSANNVAVLLARQVAGTVAAFVARMNAAARRLGMRDTHYTDPSGYDAGTVSTARDQLVLARAMRDDETFGVLVATSQARLPVAGVVDNTDTLLDHGFVGTKTGSDDAAGGCFMFRTWRVVNGTVTDMVGVVMGQRGRHTLTAGLVAARQLADRVGPAAGA